MRIRLLLGVSVALGIAMIGGCGESAPQASVQGEIKFGGRLVDGGQIRFIPSGAGGSAVEAPIVEGKYEIPTASGLEVGTYVVEVRWSRKTGKMIDSPPLGQVEETRQIIPSAYNDHSKLRYAVSPGVNEYSVALESK